MKLCVPSSGPHISSKVSGRFGKAPYFFIIDITTGESEFIENTGRTGSKSGIVAGRLILGKGVHAVLARELGGNASSILMLEGIRIFEGIEGNESLMEVVKKFQLDGYRERTE